MKKTILLFIVLTSFISISNAQTLNQDYLDINNIKALVNARAIQFFNDTVGKYEFPKGSGKNTIKSSSIWIGGIDTANQLHTSADLYNTNGTDFWAGPLTIDGTASISSSQSALWNKVWKISKSEIDSFIMHHYDIGYIIPDVILNWPWRGDTILGQAPYLAPFVDVNNDSVYNPYNGDYPSIYGDQCIFFIINDAKTHYQTLGLPIGVEIHVFAYAFNRPNDTALNNTIFYKYIVKNRSLNVLINTYMGLFTDFDIGNPNDDYIGCDVGRGMYFGYNATSSDSIYGTNPPTQGAMILGGPYLNPDGIDNPKYADTTQLIQICDYSIDGLNFGNGIVDDERFGMHYFLNFNSSNNVTGMPSNSNDYYNYLKAAWKDSTSLVYGGTGYYTSVGALPNVSANFAFPDNTDTLHWGTGCGPDPEPGYLWTEPNAGITPSDVKGIASSGSFVFKHSEGPFYQNEYIDIAYTTAVGYGTQSSVEALKQYADHIRYLFINDTTISNPYHYNNNNTGINSLNKELNFKIYPNPTKDNLTIETNSNAEQRLEIINLIGQTVYTIYINKKATINTSAFANGVYILKLYTDKEIVVRKFVKE